jgi:hypothetical protein
VPSPPVNLYADDYEIERHVDGRGTVWMSEHEPLDRMKAWSAFTWRPARRFFRPVCG